MNLTKTDKIIVGMIIIWKEIVINSAREYKRIKIYE